MIKINIFPLTRLAGELLAAAEQYQLELLKSICEEKLCSCLEIGNSVNYLVLGDMYQVCVILTNDNECPTFKVYACPETSNVCLIEINLRSDFVLSVFDMMMVLQAPILKRMAMQFVVRNMSSVVRSRDWKECLLDHPALMAEVG